MKQVIFVFPAHAGVILESFYIVKAILRIPRTRGGDPHLLYQFKPSHPVFPAHAGVILKVSNNSKKKRGIPRTRGGDPEEKIKKVFVKKYSPHTRG